MENSPVKKWDNAYLEYVERMAKVNRLYGDYHKLLYKYNKDRYQEFIAIQENNLILHNFLRKANHVISLVLADEGEPNVNLSIEGLK